MGVMDFFSAPGPSDGGFRNPSIGGGGLGGLLETGAQIIGGIFQERTARERRRAAEAAAGSGAFPVFIPQSQSRPVPVPMQTAMRGSDMGAPFTFQEASLALPQVISRIPDIFRGPVGGAVGGGIVGGAVQDVAMSLFGGGGRPSRPKCGVFMNGSTFHETPSGRVVANRVSALEDGNGGLEFFVHAGCPTAWSKVSIKKPRRCRPR